MRHPKTNTGTAPFHMDNIHTYIYVNSHIHTCTVQHRRRDVAYISRGCSPPVYRPPHSSLFCAYISRTISPPFSHANALLAFSPPMNILFSSLTLSLFLTHDSIPPFHFSHPRDNVAAAAAVPVVEVVVLVVVAVAVATTTIATVLLLVV